MEENQSFEISKEDLGEFPIAKYEGEIVIVNDAASLKAFLNEGIEKEDVIGFDTESKPSFKRGEQNKMALIQMATKSKVYLIRVSKIGYPPALCNFIKRLPGTVVGIGLDDDWRELRRAGVNIKPKHVVDLNEFAKEKGFKSIGAKKLSALLLGFNISKKQQISNWENDELTEAQINYAATDAWICRDIYFKLIGI